MQEYNMSQQEAEQVTHCQRPECNAELRGGHAWHGKLIGDEYRVTLVQCFRCARQERYDEYKQDKVITSRLLVDALYLEDADLSISIEAIHAKTKEFEQAVWFGGMQRVVTDSRNSGMSYAAPDTSTTAQKVMSFCSAGRCMITIQAAENRHVTLITEESSSSARMGLQGILATEDEAIQMIQETIKFHQSGLRLSDDKKVGLG